MNTKVREIIYCLLVAGSVWFAFYKSLIHGVFFLLSTFSIIFLYEVYINLFLGKKRISFWKIVAFVIITTGLLGLNSPEFKESKTENTEYTVEGERLYKLNCGICHAEDIKIGPSLKGIIGRRVATLNGFSYSEKLSSLGGSWTEERLVKYLSETDGEMSGSNMVIQPVSRDKAKEIVKFLKDYK